MSGIYTDPVGGQWQRSNALDRENNQLVSSLRKAWRNEFPGAALNPEIWKVVSQGAGQSYSLAAGELTINAGVNASEEFILRTVGTVSIPFRAWFIGRLSQRIINQEIRLEAINAAGDMVAGWLIDGTTAASAKHYAANSGNLGVSAAVSIVTTAANSILELEMFPDEFWAISRIADSAAGRQQSFCRTLKIPDPEQEYFLQVRVTNLATPPASNTQVILGAVAVQDINELSVEVTGGRGDNANAKAVAVAVAGTLAVSNATLTGSISYGAGSNSKVISAAGTNATLIRASALTIYTMSVSNNSASWRYLKLYNKASAPTVGTDVPAFVVGLPPGSTVTIANAVGMRFLTGLALAITAGIADTDATAIGADEVIVSLNIT